MFKQNNLSSLRSDEKLKKGIEVVYCKLPISGRDQDKKKKQGWSAKKKKGIKTKRVKPRTPNREFGALIEDEELSWKQRR